MSREPSSVQLDAAPASASGAAGAAAGNEVHTARASSSSSSLGTSHSGSGGSSGNGDVNSRSSSGTAVERRTAARSEQGKKSEEKRARASSTSKNKDRDAFGAADRVADLVAGLVGGAAGILISNPFEVLKVRLQTFRIPARSAPSASKSSATAAAAPKGSATSTSAPPPLGSASASASASQGASRAPAPTAPHAAAAAAAAAPHGASVARPGFLSLWRAEGIRFLFAGAAGPILGLAFIDSAFFGLYGFGMDLFKQDRQDPSDLHNVFIAGATSGGICALLQTPIEIVKCRAQAESSSSHTSTPAASSGKAQSTIAGAASSSSKAPKERLGSFKIARLIWRKDGLRGFYIGGLMTATRDSISSGIFFSTYFAFRRLFRGESPFRAESSINPNAKGDHGAANAPPAKTKMEIARIALAGGFAGVVSTVLPYPLDIIKTRLQTRNVESKAHAHDSPPSPPRARRPPTISFTPNEWRTAAAAAANGNANGNGSTEPPRAWEPLSPARGPHPREDRTPARSSAQGGASTSAGSTSTGGGSASSSGAISSAEQVGARAMAREIYADGRRAASHRVRSSWAYALAVRALHPVKGSARGAAAGIDDARAKRIALDVLGYKGFLRGLRPTIAASFVGSAATITTYELVYELTAAYMAPPSSSLSTGRRRGGGGGVGGGED